MTDSPYDRHWQDQVRAVESMERHRTLVRRVKALAYYGAISLLVIACTLAVSAQ